jgi:hypothetical protein
MKRLFALLVAATALSLPAAADHRPVLMPDGAIVHGDWGLHRPGHIVPYVEDWVALYPAGPSAYGHYYFPTNKGDPFAYRSRATSAPTIPGPRYQRTWGAESNLQPDINQVPQGPYVIPAPIIAPGRK